LITTDGTIIGEVDFPPGTLPVGAIIRIRSSDIPPPRAKNLGCGGDDEVPEDQQPKPLTPEFDISIKNGPK